MSTLWSAWRSRLYTVYVKPCKTRIDALKNIPPVMNKEDWEWLVTNRYLTEKFLVWIYDILSMLNFVTNIFLS